LSNTLLLVFVPVLCIFQLCAMFFLRVRFNFWIILPIVERLTLIPVCSSNREHNSTKIASLSSCTKATINAIYSLLSLAVLAPPCAFGSTVPLIRYRFTSFWINVKLTRSSFSQISLRTFLIFIRINHFFAKVSGVCFHPMMYLKIDFHYFPTSCISLKREPLYSYLLKLYKRRFLVDY